MSDIPTSSPQKTIFVIDDDVAQLRAIGRILKHHGHDVVVARDGAAALRSLAVMPVDLLLTDIFMPEKDGLEVITAVKRKHPNVPIIAMSGGGTAASAAEILTQASKIGARMILPKPFTEEELMAAVTEMLASSGSATA